MIKAVKTPSSMEKIFFIAVFMLFNLHWQNKAKNV